MDLAFIGQITFSRNFDNNWNESVNFRQIFKIILINGDSFLQTYVSEMNFLTYWFLKIKWLFAKSVKITKEIAIHRKWIFAKFLEKACLFGKFIGWTKPFFPLILFTLGLLCVKCHGEGSRFNHFKYHENHKSYVLNFRTVNTPRYQILIWMCKVFSLFQQTFSWEKDKGNIMKIQNTSTLKHFSLPRYSKKWTA